MRAIRFLFSYFFTQTNSKFHENLIPGQKENQTSAIEYNIKNIKLKMILIRKNYKHLNCFYMY